MRIRSIFCTLLFAAGLVSAKAKAGAQLAVYYDENEFLAAVGRISFESFEGLAPRKRSSDPVVTSAFTVTPTPGLLGVQDGAASPENGFGAFATEGTHYLFTYREGLPAGTLQFDLAQPVTAFAFDVTDLGEAPGTLTLTTNAGESLTPQIALQAPPLLSNGNRAFFGIVQTTPFTQVYLTSTGVDDSYGLDKIYTRSAATSAPGALLTGVAGALPGLCALLRRRAALRPRSASRNSSASPSR